MSDAVCIVLGNALGKASAEMKPKLEFCFFHPYFLARCAQIVMGWTQDVVQRISFGGFYDPNCNVACTWGKRETETNRNTWLYSDLVPWLLWVAADFCCTVGTHHWGINERKNTLEEMIILICWAQTVQMCGRTNKADLLQIQLDGVQ